MKHKQALYLWILKNLSATHISHKKLGLAKFRVSKTVIIFSYFVIWKISALMEFSNSFWLQQIIVRKCTVSDLELLETLDDLHIIILIHLKTQFLFFLVQFHNFPQMVFLCSVNLRFSVELINFGLHIVNGDN